jgi:hypothetical protein
VTKTAQGSNALVPESEVGGGCSLPSGCLRPLDPKTSPYDGEMDVQQLLSKLTDNLTVGRVFGEPIPPGRRARAAQPIASITTALGHPQR